MSMKCFFTTHDEAGNRIDADSDCRMTEEQVARYLKGCAVVTLGDGEEAYDDGGQFLRVEGVED